MRNTVTQLWGTNSRMAALSTITGGGKWVEITVAADPLYQHLVLTAERKFWHCVRFGDTPRLFGVEPPRPRIEALRSGLTLTTAPWAPIRQMLISFCARMELNNRICMLNHLLDLSEPTPKYRRGFGAPTL